jgi:Tfp pilus assembly protein PilX
MATRSLSPALARAKRRAAARRGEEGAVLFVVAMIIAVLGSVGLYALAAASTEVRASGNERQSTQTHYLAQYGMLAAANYVQNDTTLYEQLATASPDWPCTSLPGLSQQADALLRACFRIEEGDLTNGWSSTSPLVDYGGAASSTSGTSSGGSSGTSVPPLTQGMAPGSLGPTPMTAHFFVELTSPTQKAAPSRYALDLHFCFHEYTATAVGVTQPIYSQQSSNPWGAYSAQGQEMQRARFLLGPDRNCQ